MTKYKLVVYVEDDDLNMSAAPELVAESLVRPLSEEEDTNLENKVESLTESLAKFIDDDGLLVLEFDSEAGTIVGIPRPEPVLLPELVKFQQGPDETPKTQLLSPTPVPILKPL